jgi:hypothetical protein
MTRPVKLTTLFLGLMLTGCSVRTLPWVGESCTIRADIDGDLLAYIKSRYDETLPKRFAVLPFDVPENFTPPGNLPGGTANSTAQQLARMLQSALLAQEELGIVEVFDRENWPRKRDEFFRGNYQAIEQARLAGYDFVIVGMLEPLTEDTMLRFQTKLIDTATSFTIWSGMTEIFSNERDWNRLARRRELLKGDEQLFRFRDRFEYYAQCTAPRMIGKTSEQ